MSPLVAAMVVLLESGSVPRLRPPRAMLEVRERPGLWLSAPAPAALRDEAAACGLLGCNLSAPLSSVDRRSLAARTQALVLGVVETLGGRLGAEPVTHAASWIAGSGLQLDVRPQRVLISLRLPTP